MSKMRNVDAGGDLPGVRIPDQPCQEKENDEEKHHSLYKDLKKIMGLFDFFNHEPEDEDAVHYNNYRNGVTDHGTFVGTCNLCGTVWEFESYEVLPVPYPHGTCPNCHQWVAVF